ncbi:unnamed protein product [Sphagnum jensenii]|uniref:Uncharacterized protein n=1 Tax=Sphagnum jensenii TaxID=128206 RepID=A0ABP1BQX2_9BRYO
MACSSQSSQGCVAHHHGGGASMHCEAAGDNTGFGELKEAADQFTKKEITKAAILRNQETTESEKQSVFGAVPKLGLFYPHP